MLDAQDLEVSAVPSRLTGELPEEPAVLRVEGCGRPARRSRVTCTDRVGRGHSGLGGGSRGHGDLTELLLQQGGDPAGVGLHASEHVRVQCRATTALGRSAGLPAGGVALGRQRVGGRSGAGCPPSGRLPVGSSTWRRSPAERSGHRERLLAVAHRVLGLPTCLRWLRGACGGPAWPTYPGVAVPRSGRTARLAEPVRARPAVSTVPGADAAARSAVASHASPRPARVAVAEPTAATKSVSAWGVILRLRPISRLDSAPLLMSP